MKRLKILVPVTVSHFMCILLTLCVLLHTVDTGCIYIPNYVHVQRCVLYIVCDVTQYPTGCMCTLLYIS